jgi:hypothetical protein
MAAKHAFKWCEKRKSPKPVDIDQDSGFHCFGQTVRKVTEKTKP